MSTSGPEDPEIGVRALPDSIPTAPVSLSGLSSEMLASGAVPSFYFLENTSHLSGQAAGFEPAGIRVPGFDGVLPQIDASKGSGSFDANLFDVNKIRRDFPILQERVNGRPLIWLDNAATTQKPQAVLDRLKRFYEYENSNIHRAAHEMAARATDAYEAAREKVRGFLNAASTNEIVFLRGATEAINLVAQSWGRQNIGKDDEIVLTWLEHHANIVPWQRLTEEKGARLKVAPVDEDGQVLLSEYGKLLGPKTKLAALAQVSNALGTVTPAKQMIEMAHAAGAKVLLDGAQAVSHMRVDVQLMNPDWYVFSGHKIFAPTGIGVLYGKEALLNEMPPWQGGGNMITDVTFERSLFQKAPWRFEAGTGNIAGAVGLGAAIDYVIALGMDLIEQYEHHLLLYATRLLKNIPGLRLIGTAPEKAGVLSLVINGLKTEDIGAALNREGIAVRSGHHCAQPILRRFGLESTVRPSLALYNTCSDIDALITALTRLVSGQPLT
jgi:cysteine desulfurase / selenocysteine lyase